MKSPSHDSNGFCVSNFTLALALVFIFLQSPAFGVQRSDSRSQWEWEGVKRVVAAGDIHGSLHKLGTILQATKLTDERMKWTGGDSHFVLCGDLIDRGTQDRDVLELVQRLEKEAKRKGGRVHVLLGNHDAMNLVRDFRYVTKESHKSYVQDERSSDRQQALKSFVEQFGKPGMDPGELKKAFENKYPPGFFGRIRAFGMKGKYGPWLLGKPAVIKIDDIVFVHGGLTPEVAALGFDEINRQIAESLKVTIKSIGALQTVLTIPSTYEDLARLARLILQKTEAGTPIDPKFVAAATSFEEQYNALSFSPRGPLWYRGNSLENERVEREPFSKVLELLGAKTVVVGHSITEANQITSRFEGRLFRADVGMAYGGPTQVLVFESGIARAFDPYANSYLDIKSEPPQGQGWGYGYEHLADSALERFLSSAEVKKNLEVQRRGQGAEIWEMEDSGLRLRGVFKDIEEDSPDLEAHRPTSRRYQHELAAYKLDRLLGLGMVPPVVVRTLDSKTGALRSVIESAVDLVSLKSYGGLEGLEPDGILRGVADRYNLDLTALAGQAGKVWIFDQLIGNFGREDEDKLLIPEDGKIAIVDHEQAFSLVTEIDSNLSCRSWDREFAMALRSLTAEALTLALSEYLSDDQIRAILKRREAIFDHCKDPN